MVQMATRAVVMTLFLVLVFLIETETGAQFYDQSYALVVGIDRYRSPKWKGLTYAVKDAQGMEGFLKQQGFRVTSLYNQQADRNTIIYQMQNVFAPRVKQGDRVLIFFAGHGDTERFGGNDYGYIIPHDATDSSHTYISMEELQTLSRKMGQAKHQLFIMDACYGGLLGVRGGAISEHVPNYLDEITKRKARQILTAGGPNQQVVDGGPGGHSVFTGYLLKGLREGAADLNSDGYVTFAELTSYLVPTATNTYQTPGYSALPGHELGEFVFRSLKGVTSPPTPVKPEPIEVVQPTDKERGAQSQKDWANVIASVVDFELNKSSLTELAKDELVRFAEKMRADPNLQAEIIGHSDLTRSEDQDRKLSQQRAQTVRSYLETLGVEPSRLRVDWKGGMQPIADNRTAQGRALNRRVEIFLFKN